MTAMVSPGPSLNPCPDIDMPAALLNSMYSAPFRVTATPVTEPPFKYTVTLYGLTLTVAVPDGGTDGVDGVNAHAPEIPPPLVPA